MREAHPTVRAHGIDLSREMLEVGRARGRMKSAAIADAHALPFARGSFDAVVSTSALHHWRAPLAALREIRRVLRPAGRLVLTDWSDDHLPTRLLSLALRLVDDSHHRSYRLRELEELLSRAGFGVVQRRRYRAGWRWGLMSVEARPR